MNPSRILLPLVAALAFYSCGKTAEEPQAQSPEVKVTGVSLNKTEISLLTGATETLVATVKPDDATDKTVTWSSSDEEVAIVAGGLVTALTAGTTTITASAQDKKATCQVIVSAATLELTLSSDEDWLIVSPLSGNAGVIELTLITSANSTGKSRSANISVSNQEGNKNFTIIQRPDVLTRTKASSGRVTNSVSVTYSGTKFTRIYTILPVPLSNTYQDISNWEAPGCVATQCPDGINSYIWKDLREGSIPASGGTVISESFDATVYHVTADIAKIDDIPPYDPDSEECRKYLGMESGNLVDPTHTKIVATAESLWNESGGHILEYARK